MRRELGVLVASVSFLLACGGSVDNGKGTGGSAGTGAVGGFGGGPGGDGGMGAYGGGPGGAGGIAGTGGFGGMAGTGGFGGMAGAGGVSCTQTNDHMSVKIAPAYGSPPSCAMDQPTIWEVTGSVTQFDNTGFQIDTCPPNADCMASIAGVYYQAQDLYAYIPQGSFVHVKYELMPAWGGCTERLSVVNVPSWGGMQNPYTTQDMIWLMSTEGLVDPTPEAGFKVSPVPLGCTNGAGCGGLPPDMYALEFAMPTGATTLVPMGQTTSVYTGNQELLVHNLRSYQSSACDDYWNWGWWATDLPPVK